MACQRYLLILLTLVLALSARGALAENRYQVEVIVFEHLNMNAGGEIWPEQDERPQWDNALAIFDDADDSRFTPLSSARYKMGGVYRTLRSSRGYRPILHLAWEQTGLPSSRARDVYIAADNGQVEGEIQLEQSRFLHVEMDLIYPFGDSKGQFARLQERRRMKLKELHYFDNPVFGAIVQVTRADD